MCVHDRLKNLSFGLPMRGSPKHERAGNTHKLCTICIRKVGTGHHQSHHNKYIQTVQGITKQSDNTLSQNVLSWPTMYMDSNDSHIKRHHAAVPMSEMLSHKGKIGCATQCETCQKDLQAYWRQRAHDLVLRMWSNATRACEVLLDHGTQV